MVVGPALSLRVDRDSPVPLYRQLAEEIESAISGGKLVPGARLNNELELAKELRISRPTIRAAIGFLVNRGILIRRRGIGTIVSPRPVKRPFALTSLHDDLLAAGRQPSTQVFELKSVPAPAKVAGALQIAPGRRVTVLKRLRSVDGKPIALMTNYLPPWLPPIERTELEQRGLYEVLRSFGLQPTMANQTIGARLASNTEARALGVPRGGALLYMNRIAFDDSGRPIEYGDHCYPADRYTIEMTVVRQ